MIGDVAIADEASERLQSSNKSGHILGGRADEHQGRQDEGRGKDDGRSQMTDGPRKPCQKQRLVQEYLNAAGVREDE